jgi:predicted nucleic acid-binding protein
VILLDTSGLLAALDYLLATRVGATARLRLLGEVERGAYDLQPFTASDIRNATAVIKRHADLGISLADASLVVLAARHNTQDVLTLDERHFRVLSANRKPFCLLPADG